MMIVIPLEEDFEVVRAHTASLNSRQTAIDSEMLIVPSPWTVGSDWAPEDNFEFSLDPDAGWYNEAVDANIEDLIEHWQLPKTKPKKRKTHVSVCESFIFVYNLLF